MEEEVNRDDKSKLISSYKQEIYDPFGQQEGTIKKKSSDKKILDISGTPGNDLIGTNGLVEEKVKDGDNEGDIGIGEATLEVYLREGSTKKDHSDLRKKNSQRETGQNQSAINSSAVPRATSYPELYIRSDHESEFRVHFYIKNVSTFFPKIEVYKKLYDSLQQFGETKEISFQRINDDCCDFAAGMKEDKTALEIIEKNKLACFLNSFERGEMKPYVEISNGFKAYADTLKSNNKRYNDSGRYNEKASSRHNHYSQRNSDDRDSPHSRRKSSRNQEKDEEYEKRNHHHNHQKYDRKQKDYDNRREHSPVGERHHSRFSDRGSRSRSRSKSPSHLQKNSHQSDERKRDHDRSKKRIEDPRMNAESSYYNITHHPQARQIQAMNYQIEMTANPEVQTPISYPRQNNRLPSYLENGGESGKTQLSLVPPSKDAQKIMTKVTIPAPGPVGLSSSSSKSPFIISQEVDMPMGYENYCCFLGIPLEITERQVIESLKAQNFEEPIEVEPVEEGVVRYLKLGFKSDQTVRDLISDDIYVGPTNESLIYPVLVLPCIKDKKADELLVHHQVQVDSSIPLDALFLGLFYDPYGMMVDCVDMKPTQHVLIFSKQRYAEKVLAIPNISLQKDDIEVVMEHHLVENCYPLLRKNLESHLQSLLSRYIKDAYSEKNSISPPTQEPTAEQKKLVEEVKEEYFAARPTAEPKSQPASASSDPRDRKYQKKELPQQQKYVPEQQSFNEHNYNQHYQSKDRRQAEEFHDGEEGGRREYGNYNYNQRHAPEGGRGGHRGMRHQPQGNHGYHYRGGRNPDPRLNQYPPQQHMPQQYYQNRPKGQRQNDFRN